MRDIGVQEWDYAVLMVADPLDKVLNMAETVSFSPLADSLMFAPSGHLHALHNFLLVSVEFTRSTIPCALL